MVLASTGTGDIIPDATVTVRNPGTTTNISETIYANDDPDATQLTNGVFKTDARGLAIFYLTNQKRVDVLFTKAGVTSVTIPVDVQKSSLVSGESVATSTIWDAAGDLAKGTGADTAARLARGTANQVLRTNAGATDIEWGVDPAQDKITTAGDLLYGTAADTAARLGIGTAGQVLKVNSGATAPEWGAAPSAISADAATVATNESTSSTAYTDLTTAGPAVTVTVGASGKLLVGVYALHAPPNANAALMGFALSGANTVAASDTYATYVYLTSVGNNVGFTASFVLGGLVAGSTTVTAKYKSEGGASCAFNRRSVYAVAL